MFGPIVIRCPHCKCEFLYYKDFFQTHVISCAKKTAEKRVNQAVDDAWERNR